MTEQKINRTTLSLLEANVSPGGGDGERGMQIGRQSCTQPCSECARVVNITTRIVEGKYVWKSLVTPHEIYKSKSLTATLSW